MRQSCRELITSCRSPLIPSHTSRRMKFPLNFTGDLAVPQRCCGGIFEYLLLSNNSFVGIWFTHNKTHDSMFSSVVSSVCAKLTATTITVQFYFYQPTPKKLVSSHFSYISGNHQFAFCLSKFAYFDQFLWVNLIVGGLMWLVSFALLKIQGFQASCML